MSIQRPMRKTHNLIMLIGALAVVYGCSSGSSSSGGDTPTPEMTGNPPPTQTAQLPTGRALNEAGPDQDPATRPAASTYRDSEPGEDETFEEAQNAAQNAPRRGSVTQGARVGTSASIGDTTLAHLSLERKANTPNQRDVIISIDTDGDGTPDFTRDTTDTSLYSTAPGDPDTQYDNTNNPLFPYSRRTLVNRAAEQVIKDDVDLRQCAANAATGGDCRLSIPTAVSDACALAQDASCLRPALTVLAANNLLGYYIEFIDWTDDDDSFYLGGGLWHVEEYPADIFDSFDNIREIDLSGVFVDGDQADLTNLPTTGGATYTGKSYGSYFVLPAPVSARGVFAADTTLWADFSGTPSISGMVRNFTFSDNNSLENIHLRFPNLRVELQAADVDTTNNFYEDDTTSTGLLLDDDDAASELKLSGKWGGRFFGTPGAGEGNTPLAVGGTWGAQGRRGTETPTPDNGGFSLALLGSFGLKRPITPEITRPVGVDFKLWSAQEALDVAREAGFADAAGGTAVFLDGDSEAVSSATQGGSNDRVFLTRAETETGSGVFTTTNLTIDIENDGATPLVMDATGAAEEPATGDRRVANLGTGDDAWGYGTRRLAMSDEDYDAIQTIVSEARDSGGELSGSTVLFHEADIVDWTDADDDYYMAGGVWAYYHTDSLTSDIETTAGAFVDGDATDITANPLPTSDTAIYTGHSYGRYTTLPTLSGVDINAGYFAATATLTADFANTQVSGTVSDFLFSTDRSFTAETESPLEDAFPNMVVTLGAGAITGNQFSGPTTTDSVLLDTSDPNSELELTGRWAGRFFGAPATGEAPPAVGGTWGAAGGTDLAPEDGGFSISFIGSFGAKRPPTAP